MRICFIIHQASKEGAGRFLLDEVDYLQKRAITSCVVLPTDGPLRAALLQRGVRTEIINFPWWCRTMLNGAGLDSGAILSSSQKIARFAEKWQADVIYTHTVVSPVGALGAMFAGLPHVWHIHEFSHEAENIEVLISRNDLSRFADFTSNLVVFNSRAVASEWDGALDPRKTLLVYNWLTPREESGDGASPELLQTLTGRFVIMQLGSVNTIKRQSDAIEALAQLVAGGCNAALLIVGPIVNVNYYHRLLDLVSRRGLKDRVHFIGYTETPSVWFKHAHVSVVCSPREGFGRVTIEAMFHGLPVVGAAAAGTAEIIQDNVNGLLYPPKDPSALGVQLRRLADNPELRQLIAAMARERARDFCSAEDQMNPLVDRLGQLRGKGNLLVSIGNLLSPAITILAQYDARRMRLWDLVRLIARRVSTRLGLARK